VSTSAPDDRDRVADDVARRAESQRADLLFVPTDEVSSVLTPVAPVDDVRRPGAVADVGAEVLRCSR